MTELYHRVVHFDDKSGTSRMKVTTFDRDEQAEADAVLGAAVRAALDESTSHAIYRLRYSADGLRHEQGDWTFVQDILLAIADALEKET